MSTIKITPIHYSVLIKLFEFEGFAVVKKRGDHILMTKPGVKRPLVIKSSSKKVPVAHIVVNLNTAGITRKRYFELLEMM